MTLRLHYNFLKKAGKIYLKYKRRKGVKKTPMPDFYIGAQAAVLNLNLITRDVSRYR